MIHGQNHLVIQHELTGKIIMSSTQMIFLSCFVMLPSMHNLFELLCHSATAGMQHVSSIRGFSCMIANHKTDCKAVCKPLEACTPLEASIRLLQ